jgi:hypothetical protein
MAGMADLAGVTLVSTISATLLGSFLQGTFLSTLIMRYRLACQIAAIAAVLGIASAAALADDTYDLREARDADDLTKVRAQLEVAGALRTKAEEKEKQAAKQDTEQAAQQATEQQFPLSVSAVMEYEEHRLAAGLVGRSTLRYYDKAEATIRIDKGEHRPALSPARRLIASSVTAERARLFCPTGPLTRDELDLIDIPGNSALLPLLLPGKEVKVGEKWPVPGDLLAMLLGIDLASSSDVQCTLAQVAAPQVGAGKVAKLRFSGHVDGSAGGAATEIALQGSFDYELLGRRVSRLDMHITENRGIGHVSPGLKVTCKLQLTAQPLKTSARLMDDRTIRLAKAPDAAALLLSCQSPTDGYRFLHSRSWHVMDQRQNVTALRLIDRGELLAQCNIAKAGVKTEPGKPDPAKVTTLEAYQQEVRKVLDKRFGKQISANEFTTKAGLKAFAVVVEGEAQEVPVRWLHYLLTHPSGKQFGFVFTLEPKQASRFGTAAEELVNTFRLDGPAETTKTTPAKAAAPKTATTPKPKSTSAAQKLPERKPRVAR